jgi:hypothetical protein
MDETQTVAVPLKEYLKLKEVYDHRTYHSRKGKALNVSVDVNWLTANLPGSENNKDLVREMTGESKLRGNPFKTLFSAILGFIEWFKETIFDREPFPIQTSPENIHIHLPEGYVIVEDSASSNDWRVVKIEDAEKKTDPMVNV